MGALVAMGGDGSLSIANVLHQKGLRVVGVPKTIDNDLDKTVITFGFDTAVSFATECIDRLHTTGSPLSWSTFAMPSEPSPPTAMRASSPFSRKRPTSSSERSTSTTVPSGEVGGYLRGVS